MVPEALEDAGNKKAPFVRNSYLAGNKPTRAVPDRWQAAGRQSTAAVWRIQLFKSTIYYPFFAYNSTI